MYHKQIRTEIGLHLNYYSFMYLLCDYVVVVICGFSSHVWPGEWL